ncbi:MAG: exopolysaccharide biosynthesis polyprenyl glycosylphosphotransferase [Nitrospirales bacterium]
MAETEETFSDVVQFGSSQLDAAARSHVLQWKTFGAGERSVPSLEEAVWSTQVADASPFTARWVWKYRKNSLPANDKAIAAVDRNTRARRKRVLVLGDGPLGDRIVAALQGHPSYELVGHLHKQCVAETPDVIDDANHAAESLARLEHIAVRDGVHRIVVTMTERRGLPMNQLLACRFHGMVVEDAVEFYERLNHKIALEGLSPSYFVFHGGFRWPSRSVKRGVDVLLALLALLVTIPLFILLPILVKLSSRGPVFYRQERVGWQGRRFTILKFRSMRMDAEEPGGAIWAEEHDPRVTAIGRFMRRYRIDELPQLMNVLRGDMSMVGPRPERPEFIGRLSRDVPYYAYRLAVKPGITGWAQVKFRYGATVQDAAEKLQYDLYYIKHMSVRLDGLIALKTIRTVLSRSGSR